MASGGYNKYTPTHKILEALLFYSVPRCDTNIIAHNLMNEFKTLNGVFSADKESLLKVEGIGENSVMLIKLIADIMGVCSSENNSVVREFNSIEELGRFFLKEYKFKSTEQLSILCLDAIGRKLSFEFLSEGDISSVGVSIREIVKRAVNGQVASIVLCHNHPSGIALPSFADAQITKTIIEVLRPIGVRLADHIVLGENDFVSMLQSKDFCYLFDA